MAGLVFADWWFCLPDSVQAAYVGRESCVECHPAAYDAWKGSHHDRAMDRATPESVLADFNDVTFEHHGIRSRMFRRDGKYFVNTEGPDGKMADFEVKYTLGVDPLQNYMVEFDRPADMAENEVSRVQVLRLTWDTRKEEWFYMPPPDARERLAPDDDLHWTGIAQRWNNMCADCHTTNLAKNFDPKTKMYRTTFSEIDVSCEACHGPGSVHVDLAKKRWYFWDRKRGFGLVRLKDQPETEIQTCAPCHSRRRRVYPDFRPGDKYYDFYDNELLQPTTFHADGQILDEVFEYASFVQSKMYHRGIHCTKCHDPHTMKLRHTGNEVCTSCHQHPAGKYDGPSHHHHQPGSTGALCAECHMPQTTYMEVHARRDHSIRLPRPDLSVALGTPNACSRCHLQEDQKQNGELAKVAKREDLRQYLDWILAARKGDAPVKQQLAELDARMHESFLEWYGDKPRDGERSKHFAFVLDAARRGEPDAEKELIGVVRNRRLPDIIRATATAELGRYASLATTKALVTLLEDPAPQVRSTAIGNLTGRVPERDLQKALTPLLTDPLRSVRTEAARVLAAFGGAQRSGPQPRDLERPLAEFEQGLKLNNDRAGAHLGMAAIYEGTGDAAAAIKAYQTAVRVEPNMTGPRANLAVLYDQQADVAEYKAQQATRLRNMETAREAESHAASLRKEARVLRRQELDLLTRDARLAPDNAFVLYRYGMSLYLHRHLPDAEKALRRAHELEPNDPQYLLGMVLFYKELKRFADALPLAEKLVKLRPEDAMSRQILEEIRR